jgi:hypothetical protein
MIIGFHIRPKLWLRRSVGFVLEWGVGLASRLILGRSRFPYRRLVGLVGAVVLMLDQQPQSLRRLLKIPSARARRVPTGSVSPRAANMSAILFTVARQATDINIDKQVSHCS